MSRNATAIQKSTGSFRSAGRETSATIARLRNEPRSWRATVEIRAKRFYVSGIVQGVGFRFFAERTAARFGVAGYAKNLFDGRVEIYAIGNATQLDALRDELRRGPRHAQVSHLSESEAEILDVYSNGFTIERDD
jgi:acylphosphatase